MEQLEGDGPYVQQPEEEQINENLDQANGGLTPPSQPFDGIQGPHQPRPPLWQRAWAYVRTWHRSQEFLGRQIQMMALSSQHLQTRLM